MVMWTGICAIVVKHWKLPVSMNADKCQQYQQPPLLTSTELSGNYQGPVGTGYPVSDGPGYPVSESDGPVGTRYPFSDGPVGTGYTISDMFSKC